MRSGFLAVVVAACWLGAARFAGAREASDPLEVRTLLSQTALRPGDTVRLAVEITLRPGYHINGPVAGGRGLVATSLSFEPVEGLRWGRPRFPPGKRVRAGAFGKTREIYEGRLVVTLAVSAADTLPEGRLTLRGRLRYQACTDTTCLRPVDKPLTLPVQVVAKGAEVGALQPEIFAPKAPEWRLVTLDGRTWSSAELEASVHIMAFRPIRHAAEVERLADLVAIERAYAERGLVVIVVATQGSAERVGALLGRHGVDLPVAVPTDGLVEAFESTVGRFGSRPTTLVIDAGGRVRSVHEGDVERARLQQEIDRLLRASGP